MACSTAHAGHSLYERDRRRRPQVVVVEGRMREGGLVDSVGSQREEPVQKAQNSRFWGLPLVQRFAGTCSPAHVEQKHYG